LGVNKEHNPSTCTIRILLF